jgi:hypothetical protein
MDSISPALHISKTSSARVTQLAKNSWHLEIPAGNAHHYRLAQLDDHTMGARNSFRWRPPFTLSLQVRVSSEVLPGTWGFGCWNDPFSFLMGYEGLKLRLPALPEAAWFFHASPHNYLSVRDDLPASGFLAATFSSSRIPPALVTLASPLLALTLIPGAAQWIRKLLRRMVRQDSAQIQTQETEWHLYRLNWQADVVIFSLDEVEIFKTSISPHGPLSLVIWIDNQFAALPPTDHLKYGYLPNPQPAWLEIKDVVFVNNTQS